MLAPHHFALPAQLAKHPIITYEVYEHRRDLPRVGLAALAAEAYLPFTGRRE